MAELKENTQKKEGHHQESLNPKSMNEKQYEKFI